MEPLNQSENDNSLKTDNKEPLEFKNISSTKKYYCYHCRKKFSKLYIENAPIECIFCYSQICEEILSTYEDNIQPPDEFKPYSNNPSDQEPTIVRLTNPNNPLVQLVTNLINLEYLSLSVNELKQINIQKLTKLKYLQLKSNLLENLTIHKSNKLLQYIDVSFNNINFGYFVWLISVLLAFIFKFKIASISIISEHTITI